ncbi:hypothetical protein F4810DRAFT_709237 [Camillea tinctor]|nr:hypothetical protein F4810DRAFT_709237 [Camillea tinctor]
MIYLTASLGRLFVRKQYPSLTTEVSQTFSVSAEANYSAEVIPTFQPTPYAKLRIDGIGILLLLDALISLACSPSPLADPTSLPWGTEVARLAPAVEDAASMPVESTPELRQRGRGASLVGTFSHAAGAIGIPCLGDAATLPARTRSAALVFSAAGANYALADGGRGRHYTSTVRFGLRPYLPEPYCTPASAAGLYSSGWLKRVEAATSWAERLQSYQDEYRKGVTRDFLDAHREYAAQLLEGLGVSDC